MPRRSQRDSRAFFRTLLTRQRLGVCTLAAAGLSLLSSAETWAADLVCSTPTAITVPTTYDNVTVQSGCVLTADAQVTVLNNMTIQSGGVVTHSLRLEAGLVLEVSGTLEVQPGGLVDLNAKGLRGGGTNGSVFGLAGEAYDAGCAAIVSGSSGGPTVSCGGSHGGSGGVSTGGTPNAVYGLLEQATCLGSGGAANQFGNPGGHGGGRATLRAGNAMVNGTVRANGGAGAGFSSNPESGAGSGGSVRIEVTGTLSGTGAIQAIGGSGVCCTSTMGGSGSGGGGRIAISYGTLSLPAANILARTSTIFGAAAGAAGTIYLKDNAQQYGDLIVDNGGVVGPLDTTLRTALTTLRSLTTRNQGRLGLATEVPSLTVQIDLQVTSGSTLTLNPGAMLSAATLRVNGGVLNTHVDLSFPTGLEFELAGAGTVNVLSNRTFSTGVFDTTNMKSGTFNLPAGSRLNVTADSATLGNGVTLIKDGKFRASDPDQIGALTIQSGGVVTHSLRLEAGLVLEVSGTLEVQPGGLVDLNAKGLRGGGTNGSVFGLAGEAYDAGCAAIVSGSSGGPTVSCGGSHGGSGGVSTGGTPNAVYGLLEQATCLGSGGAANQFGNPGGHGGGRATLRAGNAMVNGTVRANGGAGAGFSSNPESGAGSGGSVRIEVTGTLSGTGAIQAIGGSGVCCTSTMGGSGSGGGGRIAISYGTLSLPAANILARTSTIFGAAAGAAGTIYLKDNAQQYGDLIVDNGGVVGPLDTTLRTALTTLRSLTTRNQGRLGLATEVPSLTVQIDLQVTSGSTLTLNPGAMLSAATLRVNGGVLNTHVDLSFPTGLEFELAGAGTVNVLSNRTFSTGVFDTTNMKSGTFNLPAGSRLNVTADSATLGNGVTLIKDGKFRASDPDQIGALTIQSGGVVTHSLRLEAGLVLEVSGTLEVQPGGLVDLNAKGLRGGGTNGSVFGLAGEAYDAGCAAIVSGSSGGPTVSCGGSHGGSGGVSTGGTPNAVYGLLEQATCLGSGGAANQFGNPGGHGGGRATLRAGNAMVNGTVRANGGAGAGFSSNPESGAGSGGSVRIEVTGTLSGTGAIQAIGGSGVCCTSTMGGSGSGGGGRIAISYGTLSLPAANILARTSTIFGAAAGAAGTIYLKDNAQPYGDLIIDNGNVASGVTALLRTNLTSLRDVTVRNRGKLDVSSGLTPAVGLRNLFVDGSGSLLSQPARDLGALRLSIADMLSLTNGGAITVDADGLLGGGAAGNPFGDAGEAYDAPGLSIVSGSTGGSGGSYGGFGGGPGANQTYGDPQDPRHAGSGGSRASAGLGGSGGGRIRIDAGDCLISAGTSISAKGGDAAAGSGAQGGGSGGSIRLDCFRLDGQGTISATGGAGAGTDGHGGGGGRIALRFVYNLFNGTMVAGGGPGAGSGQPGTAGSIFESPSLPCPAPPNCVSIDSISPTRGGNAGEVTLTIFGAGLDPGADVRLIRSGEADIVAFGVTGLPMETRLTAIFDLTGRTPGLWDVVVENPDLSRAASLSAFEIIQGGQAQLFLDTLIPGQVRPLRNYVLRLEYGNDGDVDLPIPLFIVENDRGASMRVSNSEPFVPGPIQVLALGPDGNLGKLPPGSRFSVPIYFRTPDLPALNFVNFTVGIMTADATSIDWVQLEQEVRPPQMANYAWAAIRMNLEAQIGTTWADYLQAMTTDAVYLASHGARTHDVKQLFRFEYVRAKAATHPRQTLASAVDTSIEAPGIPVSFERLWTQTIDQRFRLGPLGRGWSHTYDVSVLPVGPSETLVLGPGASERRFVKHGTSGWSSGPGDTGTLGDLPGGAFELRERNGLVSVFDAAGLLQSMTEPNGNTLTLTYVSGRLDQVTHSNGQGLSFLYNADGRISDMTDSEGRQFQYQYDGSGEHLLSVTGPGSAQTQYAYTPVSGFPQDHALEEITFPGGEREFFEYDARGRLVSEYGDGFAQRIDYLPADPGPVQVRDAANEITTLHYGFAGQVLETTDPLGNAIRVTLDGHLRSSSLLAPDATATVLAYDGQGNVRQLMDALGHSVLFGYTPDLSRLDWMKDQKGNLTEYTIDALGNTTEITPVDQTMELLTYDATGNLTSKTNRRGLTVTYAYDSLSRLDLKTDLSTGRTIAYTYDTRSNVTSANDSLTGQVMMQYDARDRLTRIDYPGGAWFTFAYDSGDRRTQRVGHDGYGLNYEYDTVGRLFRLTDGTSAEIIRYTYDAAGRLSREDKGNGTWTTYAYDTAGRVLSVINYGPGNVQQTRFDYTYDANGRRTSMTTLTGTAAYAYDDLGQLVGLVETPGRTVTYSYDPAGNRVSVVDQSLTTDYTTNPMNQYTQLGMAFYSYDDDGNLISKTDTSGTTTYQWDAENRLIQVVTPALDTYDYVYDALGNRVETHRNSVVTRFVHDPIGLVDVAAEYDGMGSLITRYVHGYRLAARIDSGGAAWHYGFDALGSTRQVTSTSAQVVNTYGYDPFGQTLAAAETLPNSFEFVGAEGVTSEENDLIHMRSRYYDTALGRFVSEDPIGILGGINLYGYLSNDPLNDTDPSGLVGDDILDPCKYCGCVPKCEYVCYYGRDGRTIYCYEDCWGCGLPPSPNPFPVGPPPLPPPPPPPPPPTPPDPPDTPADNGNPQIVGSGDPNEKNGPTGFGQPQFVTGADPIDYIIYFENVSTASAPAQEVIVTDILDTDLDWSTVSLGAVGFGDEVLDDLTGLSNGMVTVPLQGTAYLVDLTVTRAQGSGTIEWRFRTIDPKIDDFPQDALAGFLPPEDGTGRGQGFVSFSVRPRPALGTGTEITNAASIVFDTNPAVQTNTWLNTIDGGPPVSTVDAVLVIPGSPTNERELRWSGADDPGGSGLRDYTILVSDNAGPWTSLFANTTATSGRFMAACGHTYSFVSVTWDFVGNVEATGSAEKIYAAPADGDGDGLCNDSDNCPATRNPSQSDADGDGTGDACETNPALYVSSEPADAADYGSIQEAVDAVAQSGTIIVIRPGNGYAETIVVDEDRAMTITGSGEGEVLVNGGTGPAFDLRSTAGSSAITLRDLTITGQNGVRALVPVNLGELRFTVIPGVAVRAAAPASLVNVLIEGGGTGVVLDPGGSAGILHSTVAGNLGAGVDNAVGGMVSVENSILHGSVGGDLLNVPCAAVSFSNVGGPDCSAVNSNLSAPPLFGSGYRLASGSPCIDRGPHPATYNGTPRRDLSGDLRLRDFDGDGLAHPDLGAYEEVNTAMAPGEVMDLTWTNGTTLAWSALSGAVEYHVYRGSLPATFAASGTCQDPLDPVRTDTIYIELGSPPSGSGWHYLVTGEDSLGSEGTLGFGWGAERSNYQPCP